MFITTMSWLINTRLERFPRVSRLAVIVILVLPVACAAQAQFQNAPATVTAGSALDLKTSGNGSATFYLLGPGRVVKSKVKAGSDIKLSGEDLSVSGAYLLTLCQDGCNTANIFVKPGEITNLSFITHPSRVSTGQRNAISGVVFAFDKFRNMVLTPQTVDFTLATKDAEPVHHNVQSANGVAWFRASAGGHAGAAQLTATINDVTSRRVVQQVAADPCNLRISAQKISTGLEVQTDPVRDCTGNPVPDGTIVSFTQIDPRGKSTVDVPIKQGVARARLIASGETTISVASGVVMGNEIRIDAGR
jgi:hypothetical protein